MNVNGSVAARMASGFGRRVYGLGVMAVGMVGVVSRDFVPGQPVAKGFPGRLVLAYVAAGLMLVAGAAVEWRRTAKWGAAVLAAYFGLVVVVLMNGRGVLKHFAQYGAYEGIAEPVAIAAGGLILYASFADVDSVVAVRLERVGRVVFGICALVFGGAHFVYMNLTAPLVPKWLPPSQTFWGYATGVGFVLAGVAILTGVKARLAAIVLTGMLLSFTFLVHLRLLPADHGMYSWSELAVNVALVGVTWVVADSLAAGRVVRA